MKTLHTSQKLACGHSWTDAWIVGEHPSDNLGAVRHTCRAHVIETGECLCPCGMRTKKPLDEPVISAIS